ncbi:MAG: cysteine synthase family protein [Nitrospinota bacterium]|nr:cysteine synthase family protein [Nitrospinota bacterium]
MSRFEIESSVTPFKDIENSQILKQIGNTPLLKVELFKDEFPDVEVYGKAEWFNPGGSVKDRPALNMVKEGINSGVLCPGKVLLDSTSGNTGIAYAMIGAALNIPISLVIPENASSERIETLKKYGADLIFSSPMEGSDGAQRMARKLYEENPDLFFMPCQYDNSFNPLAHEETTALEILDQTDGKVQHFVASLGTTGTLVGTGRGLKKNKPDVKVHAVMPSEPFHGLEGMKHIPSSIRPGIYDVAVHDNLILSGTESSYDYAEKISIKEGLFVGHSSGAALVGVHEVAKSIKKGVIVTIFPDGGDRYLAP